MLTIRSLDQPISQVVNQGRSAQLAISVTPRKDATIEDAEIFEGLVRNIEHESHAQTAYLWAYERAVIAGRGFFRINKRAADDEDSQTNDQSLCIERILNQASVYLDPYAQKADWSDGRWAFVTEDIPVEEYKRRYPNTRLTTLSTDDDTFTSDGDRLTNWIIGNDAARCYRIAEYWFFDDDGDLQWSKMNGIEFIDDPQEWDTNDIPIVPVLGQEYNVGGKRIFQGMVEPAKDSAQMLNYMFTAAVEQTGLTTRPKWVGYAGQFEGFEDDWQQANLRNLSMLEANAVTDATGAAVLPLPKLESPEPPIQGLSQMIGLCINFVRSTTGVPDAALGHVNPNDKSGKAIEALKASSEQSTSNFLDNLARGIARAGEILVALIPKIYDRPGRVVQILGADENTQSVALTQPVV